MHPKDSPRQRGQTTGVKFREFVVSGQRYIASLFHQLTLLISAIALALRRARVAGKMNLKATLSVWYMDLTGTAGTPPISTIWLAGSARCTSVSVLASKRVPDRLQEAVARVLKLDKPRLVFLKRSLGTKATREANTRAKPIQMEFDRMLERAEALLIAKPVRRSLSAIEVRRAFP
ncbi:hypothetical protein ACFFWD_10415 [Bradyrhizobium erythrophlei]|uniref:hypothetical protein n=1 Tax=Bradyrhizobium erythrophlei TaxID=1437360 RepID=UPI0035ED2365